MTFLPSVIRAHYRGGFRIHLTFNDLSERTVDFRRSTAILAVCHHGRDARATYCV